jgi:hypothetical protein
VTATRRGTDGPLRVLHCPTDTGGHPQQLARAEREVGLASRSVTFHRAYFGYRSDEVLVPEGAGRLRAELTRFALLRRALRDFDVVHFNFGRTILPPPLPPPPGRRGIGRAVGLLYSWYARLLDMRDLDLLRRAGKGIVVTFQGDDARQGDVCRARFPISMAQEVDAGYYTPAGDRAKRRVIARFAATADRIFYLNPDLAWVLPDRARFVPYVSVDLREWRQVPPRCASGPPVVVHAPTHRGAKGTRFLVGALDRLRAEGVPHELVLVEGMTRDEARRAYERADLVVDQLLAGWYGGLAVEAMALGKPVVAYLRDEDLGCLPPAMRDELPLIRATPATIADVLREWLGPRRAELPSVGARGRAFVERWHDPIAIALEHRREYEAIVLGRKAARLRAAAGGAS